MLKSLNYPQRGWRSNMAKKGKMLSDLYMALDELCLVNKAPNGRSNKTCFQEEIDSNVRKTSPFNSLLYDEIHLTLYTFSFWFSNHDDDNV